MERQCCSYRAPEPIRQSRIGVAMAGSVWRAPAGRAASPPAAAQTRARPAPHILALLNGNPVQVPLRRAAVERIHIQRGAGNDRVRVDSACPRQLGNFRFGTKSAGRDSGQTLPAGQRHEVRSTQGNGSSVDRHGAAISRPIPAGADGDRRPPVQRKHLTGRSGSVLRQGSKSFDPPPIRRDAVQHVDRPFERLPRS
jgi:hypothetical protein